MPSTNKLSSRTTRSVAKFLLSFCGLASFGVVTKLVALGAAFLVLFAIPVSITLLNTNNTYATGSGNSNTITANLPGSVAIRLLDSTGTTEISSLDFNNLTPTPQGTTASKSFIVDVATSNPTGYKLYMQSDYQTKDSSGTPTGNYTTNLTHTDSDVTDSIPTSTASGSKVYWNYVNPRNYVNPLTNSGSSNPTPSVIPPYGTPDKIAQYFSPTNSHQSTIDINVGIDTTIVSGTYENQLLFSAVGNPDPVAYDIDFNADGGTPEPADIATTASASIYSTTIPTTAPVKIGYTFSHWEITSVSSTSPNPDIAPSATCNSNNNSNSSNNATTCSPGDTLVIDAQGEDGVDVVLTAIYTINSHTVTLNNGTGIDSTTISCSNSSSNTTGTCTYGDTVTISATPSTGYTFNNATGWTVVSGGVTVENGQFTMPDSSVTITANATKMYTYTLNLNNNDGTTDKQVLNYPTSGGATDTTHTFTNLNSLAPSRSGYKFLGWATSASGTSYVNSYTLNSSSASTTPTSAGFPVTGNLYARWEQAYDGLMQDKAMISQCNKSAVGTTFNLLDTRDNKIYQVRKLADGKCWMAQNLALIGNRTLTPDDSNVTSNITWNPTDCTSYTDNCAYYHNTTYGTYYNWYSATAGTSLSSGTASRSICPRGWKLPSANGTGTDFQDLYAAYGNSGSAATSANLRAADGPNLVLAGSRLNGSFSNQGSSGFYWSSTASSGSNAYYLNLSTSNVAPALNLFVKYNGFSVRCVAEKDLTDITTMQEMTSNICAKSARGASNTLTDTRDGKSYTVKKLDDDKCWMTQNLALTAPSGGKLTSADSNVTSDMTWGTNSSTCSSITEWCVTTDSNHPEYGAYYNYYVATAKTNPSSGNASQSICPRGWKLPSTNGTSTDLQVLYNNYNSSAKLRAADGPNLVLAGRLNNGSFRYKGSVGYYWSSTAYTNTLAYYLYLNTSGVYPANLDYYKFYGFSVRCVAQ